MSRLSPAVLLLVLCPACTEYLGPPASPAYWKQPQPEPEDVETGPRAIVEEPPPPQREVVFLKAGGVDERVQQPRARSISLGYTSDAVLSGGVTRDTVMEPRSAPAPYEPTTWQDYVTAPKWKCAAPLSRGRHHPVW